MEIKIHRSIKEIGEKDWNSIVKRNSLICRYNYIEAIENAGINDCRYYYPVVYDDGEIVAHTSVYFISTELDLFAQGALKKIIHLIRRKWAGFFILRSLECGTPVSLGNTFSFRDGMREQGLVKLMARAIEDLAKELHINVLLFRDFLDDELDFYNVFKELEYTKIYNLPNTKIEIKWNDFDEYLSSMRSQHRWKTANRIKGFHKEGITIELVKDFSKYAVELEGLCRNVYENAKEYKRERLPAVFFRNTDTCLGDDSEIILVRKNGVPIGFTLLFFDDDVLIPIFSGLDYEYNRKYNVYFNLLYKIIDVAIQRNMKEVDLGITTLTPKKEIGATIVPLNMYMKHSHPFLNKIVPKLFEMMTPKDNTNSVKVFKDDV